ncbi:MAG: hypothetical protein ACI9DC_003153 [Gammaproteobacteria bacterium]|jgi:hypothetical protein
MNRLMGLAVVVFVTGIALARPALAQDDPRAVALFNVQRPFAAMLNVAQAKGKALVVVLRSDASYTGKVKDVGTEGVILTGLAGKEFFDAWIRLDNYRSDGRARAT